MAFNTYPNGAGGLTGDEIAVNKPLYIGGTGHIWYVSSLLGTDAASPRGREREKPLATLGQAVTNAAAGDVIILLENHAETITVAIAPGGAKPLTIVSEGQGSSRGRLTCGAAIAMITLSAPGSSLNDIYFPASVAAAPTVRVDVTGAGVVCDNCYFECGAFDTNRTYRITAAAGSDQLTNATFVATASQPAIAIELNGAAGLFLEEVTVDGGSFGFSDFAIKNTTAAATGIYANQMHQLNNADVQLINGWTGVWNPGNTSGSARFEG